MVLLSLCVVGVIIASAIVDILTTFFYHVFSQRTIKGASHASERVGAIVLNSDPQHCSQLALTTIQSAVSCNNFRHLALIPLTRSRNWWGCWKGNAKRFRAAPGERQAGGNTCARGCAAVGPGRWCRRLSAVLDNISIT